MLLSLREEKGISPNNNGTYPLFVLLFVLCKLFRKTKPVDVECGALFHAAHGVVLYREKLFGPRSFAKDTAAAVTASKAN